jgi:hypothetical protein
LSSIRCEMGGQDARFSGRSGISAGRTAMHRRAGAVAGRAAETEARARLAPGPFAIRCHQLTQGLVNPGLITLSLLFKPTHNVGIEAKRHGRFYWFVKRFEFLRQVRCTLCGFLFSASWPLLLHNLLSLFHLLLKSLLLVRTIPPVQCSTWNIYPIIFSIK